MKDTIATSTEGTFNNDAYFWKKKSIISFILSVFVVLIHASSFAQYSNRVTENLPAGIYFCQQLFQRSLPLIAVPLFFVISGALFFRNYENSSFLEKAKKRMKSLVVPYFIWNILNMLFAIVTSYSFVSKFFLGRPIFQFTFSNVFLSVFHHKQNGPFWFVFALICFIIISPIINAIISNKFVGILAIVSLIVLQHFNIGIPERFILEQESIIYYLIGCLIGKHFFPLFQKKASRKESFIALFVFASMLLVLLLQTYKIIPRINTLKTIVLIFAIFSFWILCDLFIDRIKLKPYMEHSFLIYAMHFNVQAIIVKLIYLIGPKFPFMAIVNFVVSTILTIAAIIVFSETVKKYLPKAYSILSGSR